MSMVRHDDLVREALAYLLEARAERPGAALPRLLDEAGMRYNLSPLDAERLVRLLRDEGAPDRLDRPDQTGRREQGKAGRGAFPAGGGACSHDMACTPGKPAGTDA